MEPLLVRKNRPSLDVEPLEDRRMLSMFAFATAPAWDGFARSIDTQAETAPMSPGQAADPRVVAIDPKETDPTQVSRFHSPDVVSDQAQQSESDSFETVCVLTTSASPEPEASNPVVSSESVANPVDPVEASTQKPFSASNEPPDASSVDPNARESSLVSTSSLATIPALASPSRVVSTFSSTRSSVGPTTTSARSEVSSTNSESPSSPARSALDPTLLVVTSATSSTAEGASSSDQAKGLAVANLPIGLGTLAGQSPSVLMFTPLKEAANLPTPVEIPVGWGVEAGQSEIGESGSPLQTAGRPADFELPEPALADTIQSFLPFDRSAIDAAFDRFFEPFDDLTSSMPELRGPLGLIYGSLAAAAAVVAVEVAIRLRRVRDEDRGADEIDGLATFPGPRWT